MREILFSTKCLAVAASLSSKAARKECVSVVHFQPFGRSRKRSISGLSWPPSISIMVPLTIIIIGDASMTTRLATSSTSAMRPMGIEAGASLSASARGIFMSRAIASTSPAQRSVLTGPGLTATKLILSRPYCPASDIVRFCPAALAAPRADFPIGRLHAVIADQVHHAAAALADHDRQHVAQTTHIAHEFKLQPLLPIVLGQMLDHASGRRAGIVDHDIDAAERLVGLLDEVPGVGILPQIDAISPLGLSVACMAPSKWVPTCSAVSMCYAMIIWVCKFCA